jgi:prepilin-type N-terminal cleavage/methylation domain-containing protein
MKGGDRMFKLFKKEKGFTLIELMVVVAIIAILAAVVASQVADTTGTARSASKKTDVNAVQSAVDRWFTDNSDFPWVNWTVSTDGVDLDATNATTGVLSTQLDLIEYSDASNDDLLDQDYLRTIPTHEGLHVWFDGPNKLLVIDIDNDYAASTTTDYSDGSYADSSDDLQIATIDPADTDLWIDVDDDGEEDLIVDATTAVFDKGSPWLIDNEGNVYCLIPDSSYGS